jgi:DeoR/GlpR family transcriptional regulator of sugar metabolism
MVSFIRSISADIVFFSSQGISDDGEISDVSEEETAIRRVMLERAKYKVFLCDSSKIGVRKSFRLCSKDDVDRIICDVELPW